MRIMVWTNSFWPHIGGVEVLGAKLFTALKARGHKFLVVTRRDPIDLSGEDSYKGIPIHRFPTLEALKENNINQLLQIRDQIVKLKSSFKPDLIYLYQTGSDIFFHQHTINAHPAPVLVTLHEVFPDLCVEPDTLIGHTLRTADWISACSADVLDKTRQQINEIESFSSVIPNCLEEPNIQPEALSFKEPTLLCLGRVVRRKGFDLVLKVLSSLICWFPKLRLIIAGDGSSLSELKQEAVKLGIKDRVEFMGWVSPEKVPALINQSSIVVVPSREEPFGLVALQASQMARPVVASRVGGLSEIIVHNETGLLVEKEDARALADAIAFLLDHPEVAVRMGQNGRKRAHEIFNWDRYVNAYDQLFQQLGQKVYSYESAD